MFKKRRIIVIKIGSSVIMTRRNKVDEFRLVHIAEQIYTLHTQGIGVILVVSGAVACGIYKLINLNTLHTNRSDSMKKCENGVFRAAAAGIGQAYLISMIFKIFEQKGLNLAQILLTKEDFESQNRIFKLTKAIEFYLRFKIIPVFNENDVLDLNSFGGNDLLAAEITMLMKAEKLLILSTLKGSIFGVGGGETKFKAVSKLKARNISTSIANGKMKNILLQSLL